MISSVSSVSFRGEKDWNSLINSPGNFSQTSPAASAPSAASNPVKTPEGDKADLSTKKDDDEKNSTAALVGGIVGALALIWIGLGVAVKKSPNWTKIENAQGLLDHTKNFFRAIGKSAADTYDATLGKWFSGKAKEAANNAGAGENNAS